MNDDGKVVAQIMLIWGALQTAGILTAFLEVAGAKGEPTERLCRLGFLAWERYHRRRAQLPGGKKARDEWEARAGYREGSGQR